MEDEDPAMLLYSVILMNQNISEKSKPRKFWAKPLYLERKKKRGLSKSSSRNEIGRQRKPF